MKKQTKIKFHIIIVFAIILLTIATVPKTLQEDTYYMIKVGEEICRNGMQVVYDRIEPFSWHEGLIYTYPHWLLDIIFYLIFSTFDILGIYVLTFLIGIVIYLLIYYTNIKIGKNSIISAIITIISIYLLKGFITARAQIITYICCILTILFIERFLETRKKRYFIGLILIPIVLANCHAALFPIYFVIYLPYIAEYLISFVNRRTLYAFKRKKMQKQLKRIEGELSSKNTERALKKKQKIEQKSLVIEKRLEKIEKNKEDQNNHKVIIERNPNSKWLILHFIICIFTGLLTPLKDIPYTYMIKSIQGNTMNFISEHQPVVPIKMIDVTMLFVIIFTLLISNKVKIRLRDLFMILGMGILGLISHKQFPIFLIGTMCIINKLSYMMINQNIKQKIIEIMNKIICWKVCIYSILIIIILFLVQYKQIAIQNYVDNNTYPVQAASWLKANVNIEKMRLFNEFDYGSYLLLKDIPVFIDGRADVYDPVFNKKEEDIFIDHMLVTSLETWYEEIFEKYDITHIITKTHCKLNIFLQRNIDYKNIYNDGTFSIYERKN